ncbi:MAG TPA: hypothetical protein VIJ05_10925, partial [Actinomycetes bacterium]
MKDTAWRLYLGVGALATGAYYLLSPGAGAVLTWSSGVGGGHPRRGPLAPAGPAAGLVADRGRPGPVRGRRRAVLGQRADPRDRAAAIGFGLL